MSGDDGFEGEIVLGETANRSAPTGIGALTARFVRYDGCQQITLWLPQDGYSGYGAFRIQPPAARGWRKKTSPGGSMAGCRS